MELIVTVTLSDRLFELLEDKLPNIGRRARRAVKKEAGALVENGSSVSISVKKPVEEKTVVEAGGITLVDDPDQIDSVELWSDREEKETLAGISEAKEKSSEHSESSENSEVKGNSENSENSEVREKISEAREKSSEAREKSSEHSENSEKEVTVEDCRAALQRCRVRIEGEDYESKSTEGYKKYHKAISATVKRIVMTVSGGKAEKIPDLDEDARRAFISEMDALKVDESGKLTRELPF